MAITGASSKASGESKFRPLEWPTTDRGWLTRFPRATETSGQAKRLFESLLNSIAAVYSKNIMLGTWSMLGG